MADYITTILNDDILKFIPKRNEKAHKGTYGKVLVIAGSLGMSGAAYFCSLAAYRSGAGMVKIFTPDTNRVILQTSIPEALISTYDEEDITNDRESFRELISKEIDWSSIIIIGPGLGNKPYVKILLEEVLSLAYVPIIIDADAINTIAKYPYLEQYFTENIILTPHLKEMERLSKTSLELIEKDIVGSAYDYCENHNISLVLKSSQTVIISRDKIYLNNISAPALSKAGSGDILVGIMAALFCLGIEDSIAPALAVYIHNLAARLASKKYSEHGTIARDIINCIPLAMEYHKKESKSGRLSFVD